MAVTRAHEPNIRLSTGLVAKNSYTFLLLNYKNENKRDLILVIIERDCQFGVNVWDAPQKRKLFVQNKVFMKQCSRNHFSTYYDRGRVGLPERY